jgi:hypothetical protein
VSEFDFPGKFPGKNKGNAKNDKGMGTGAQGKGKANNDKGMAKGAQSKGKGSKGTGSGKGKSINFIGEEDEEDMAEEEDGEEEDSGDHVSLMQRPSAGSMHKRPAGIYEHGTGRVSRMRPAACSGTPANGVVPPTGSKGKGGGKGKSINGNEEEDEEDMAEEEDGEEEEAEDEDGGMEEEDEEEDGDEEDGGDHESLMQRPSAESLRQRPAGIYEHGTWRVLPMRPAPCSGTPANRVVPPTGWLARPRRL